jgi:hypothetical protein
MNLFGQSSAASPKARPSWTAAYNPKVFMAGIPVRDVYPLKREEGMDGQLRRFRRSDHRDLGGIAPTSFPRLAHSHKNRSSPVKPAATGF